MREKPWDERDGLHRAAGRGLASSLTVTGERTTVRSMGLTGQDTEHRKQDARPRDPLIVFGFLFFGAWEHGDTEQQLNPG